MEKVQKKANKEVQNSLKIGDKGEVSQLASITPLMLKKSNANALAFGSMNNSVQKKDNQTGLPDNLKSGIESLSGHSMDDVNVHYNSAQPAQLNAHAFAQGSDIHVASGQEKHLPHEAWHVVQQKQGRVQPTRQMKGKVNINDDEGLEHEADVMGEKALQKKKDKPIVGTETTPKGTEKINELVIIGNKRADSFAKDVNSSFNFALNRALIMGNSYGIAVLNACEDFKVYSKSKIGKLEGEITGAELASVLTNTILSVVGGGATSKIVAKVTNDIGKSIVGVMSSTFQSGIMKGVTKASKGDDIKDLKESIDLISKGARDASANMKDQIRIALERIMFDIQTKINRGKDLTFDEEDFTASFYLSSASNLGEDIASYLGIPESSIEIQINIYQGLVEEFEKKYFMAAILTLGNAGYWIEKGREKGISGQREYAHTKAEEVANKRRKEFGIKAETNKFL